MKIKAPIEPENDAKQSVYLYVTVHVQYAPLYIVLHNKVNIKCIRGWLLSSYLIFQIANGQFEN